MTPAWRYNAKNRSECALDWHIAVGLSSYKSLTLSASVRIPVQIAGFYHAVGTEQEFPESPGKLGGLYMPFRVRHRGPVAVRLTDD